MSEGSGVKRSSHRPRRSRRKPQSNKSNDNPTVPSMHLVFIVDPSCFTKGLGHVMQWVKFIQEQGQRDKKIGEKNSCRVTLYLSTYTMEELNFLKQNKNLTSAQKSLKFIDTNFEYFQMEMFGEQKIEDIVWSSVLKDLFFGSNSVSSSHRGDSDDDDDSDSDDEELEKDLIKKLNQATVKIPSRYKKLIKSYHLLNSQYSSSNGNGTETTKVFIVSADIYVLQDLNHIFNGQKNGNGQTTSNLLYYDDSNVSNDQRDEEGNDRSGVSNSAVENKIEILDILKADVLINKIFNDNALKISNTSNKKTSNNNNNNNNTATQIDKIINERNSDIQKTALYKKDVYASRGKGQLWTP